jgi:SAM-dependent methyltransferase
LPSSSSETLPDLFARWLAALDARHLADLRVPEVTRALRALSSAYVERRLRAGGGATPRGAGSEPRSPQRVRGALDSAGKRAAFALFYAPLHFLATDHVVRALGAHAPAPSSILDIGCGTGAAGAAWALAAGGPPVTGIDRDRWAVEEARWTYRQVGVQARAHRGDATRLPTLRPGSAVVAAYVLNELSDAARQRIEDHVLAAAATGVRVLVLEPIARAVAPWWDVTAARVRAAGGRADEWRFALDLPPLLRLLDKAAGLNHREITARSLFCPGQSA